MFLRLSRKAPSGPSYENMNSIIYEFEDRREWIPSDCIKPLTSMEHNHQLSIMEPLISNPDSYRLLMGHLIYLTVTRPDWAAKYSILLDKVFFFALFLICNCRLVITQRSLIGFFISLDFSPFSWKSKKQHTIFPSSLEANYQSMRSPVVS